MLLLAGSTIPTLDGAFNPTTAPWTGASPATTDAVPPGPGCAVWEPIQSVVFQAACLLFVLGYLAPSNGFAAMFVMHAFLSFGFMTLSLWGLLYICAMDIFAWNLVFCLLNVCHAGYLGYQVRPVQFTREERDLYNAVFKPFQVPRSVYRDLCHIGKTVSLKIGEHYAEQGGHHATDFPSSSLERETVLDSPEWESFSQNDTTVTFQVTLTATTYCRYMCWQRDNLKQFLETQPYLKQVFSNVIGTDITKKLYLLTERNLNDRGSRADIRLPSVAKEASPNHDLRGHLAAGGMGACGVGIPVMGTSENMESTLQVPYGQGNVRTRQRPDTSDSV